MNRAAHKPDSCFFLPFFPRFVIWGRWRRLYLCRSLLFRFVSALTLPAPSSSSSLPSTRGPPDISSLVPIGPKYTMKWSAPLQQVQVVEVGQEGPQPGKDALYQQGGVKRPAGVCASGKR